MTKINAFDALGEFIERNFFSGNLPNGYSMCIISANDAESENEWCGRYFNILHEDMVVRAWVGWLYGIGGYKDSPKFVVQIAKNEFHALPGSRSPGWYADPIWKKWMEKDISNSLSDMTALARSFQHEMELLCTSD